MKSILKSLLFLILLTTLGHAHTVKLEWNANPPEDAVTGYRIYEAVTVSGATTWKPVADTLSTTPSHALLDVKGGKHVYAVTAYNAAGESNRSNEVAVSAISTPSGLKATVITILVEPR